MHTLATLPQEVLEHIAFFSATDPFLGPPAGVVPLLAVNRHINDALSLRTNPHLWARIFAYKFDLAPAVRRLGTEWTTTATIAQELVHRCTLMSRIRRRTDTTAPSHQISSGHKKLLLTTLWMAYLMMLENDGNNAAQLREYARIDEWLKEYLFHYHGASRIRWCNRTDYWPPANEDHISLAVWLFWLTFIPDEYGRDDPTFRDAVTAFKIIALGAHEYHLCIPPWQHFAFSNPPPFTPVVHFGATLHLVPPPPAAPAFLAYMALVSKLTVALDTISYMKRPDLGVPSMSAMTDAREWDAEWGRAVGPGDVAACAPGPAPAFIPGSLEGSWEGLFTYTDFTAYAALLSGGKPSVLEQSLVAQHSQLWRLREHHLYASDDEDGDGEGGSVVDPLSPGNPLRGYLPLHTEVNERPEGLEVSEPGKSAVFYESWAKARKLVDGKSRRVRDTIIIGEGHSAWGQFNLIGRVRPCDGFISLSKDYMNGERGRWLYRGYLVGNANGNLSGRWRDTLSPPDVPGYEGCFLMSRRK
ncbi:hypothetical protein WOLCODRAFT_164259 [Wolfiporia cocos MD-104 SS10]|uniref:F-box domain-containing protein n=1 Tax=Wolfiporia cocos (strain MD-104) TaxID=742152 RepID=A0A2H3JLQ3_WOLCO|nr:hypothetical protein WOLCODRAFT_164259 [Wolfiporia cocos MD-104 SS10]